jgi:uncharacterized protein (TIGR03435 family)
MLRTITIGGLMLGVCHTSGQTAPPRPEFEVASIKLNRSGAKGMTASPRPGGRYITRNAPLEIVLKMAYHIRDFQLSGAPAWLESEHYDIEAKAPGDATFTAMLPMLQALLEERLQLQFHRETKEAPVYAMVITKEGKLSDVGECGPHPSPPPPRERGKLPTPGCGTFIVIQDLGRIIGSKMSISQLIDVLPEITGRLVLDQTKLTGRYDINLSYAPEQLLAGDASTRPPGSDSNAPSIFTALQEQLGLKLESQKGPVEMFVIDHVERPSEN